jgi:phospholipid/cholesterol/gamma-HCH transport system permease protein
VVSGRVGAGIGAELGSMKVTEQIDAIEASGVNSYKLLAFTRILACILMVPLLTLAADFAGIATGWLVDTMAETISLHKFLHAGFARASFSDFLAPTFRTAVFGLIIGVIACFQGMRSQGGTEGVGRSATSSVVLSSLFVMLADVILTKLILVFFP